MKNALFVPLYAVALLAQPVFANDAHHNKSAPELVAQTTAKSEGEIRKIDKESRKITLKHGPIVNLDMPGMTMVFRVAEPAMLDKMKVGDKVRFVADKVDGAFTVTAIEAAR